MKKLIPAAFIAAALAIPAVSFAQAAQPLTRAQVRAQLVELENAGYDPVGNDVNYPQNLQAAQRRVEQARYAQRDTSGYGKPAAGTSAAGSVQQPVNARQMQEEYGH